MNTDNTSSVTTFSSFDLPKPLSDALETMRYREPTPIQTKAIPVVMEGKDLIGIAQTGTGKTAAFGIPLVKRLFEDKEAQAVILVPTRELAVQIYEVIRQLTQNTKTMKAWVLVGGTSMYAQVKSLPRKPRIIIATPGRLMDHLDKKTISMQDLKIAVLDEADRMLDIGFEPQINRIFQKLPKERQTLLFSATFPKTIERLTREYMNHPAKITVGKVSEPAKEIEQSFVHTTVAGKQQLLINELNTRTGSVLIFVRTKHKVDRIARLLMDEGFEADRIHGARTQGQRNRVMQDFRTKKIRIMVATDVASRGIDIPHIEHVINYDIPEVPEDYVHRIGRTARAGAKGQSISFLTSEDKSKWMYLQRHLNALGVKTAFNAIKPASILDKPIQVKNADGTVAVETKREPMVEYKKPRDYANTTSRYNRSQGHFKRQSESRGDSRGPRNESRSFAPRGDSRPSGGFDRSRGPRPEGRSFAPRGEGRPYEPRGDSRGPKRSYAPRGNGPRPSRPYAPRDDSRGPRPEGRSFGNRDSRPAGRSDRPSYGRPDSMRPRSEGRPYAPRGDSRGPRSDSRGPRSEGRSFAPRGEGRPYAPRGDSRGPRSEGRSFAPRSPSGRSFGSGRAPAPTGDRRPADRQGRPYGGSNSKPFPRTSKPTSRPFNRDR